MVACFLDAAEDFRTPTCVWNARYMRLCNCCMKCACSLIGAGAQGENIECLHVYQTD